MSRVGFRPPIDDRKTPAYRLEDGVDYVPMGTGRVFLIQLLNIAGLGPIFGALAGAMWGPAVFLWITFGTVFAGGVHDFISGLLSERNDGASISEIVGKYLGDTMRHIMRGFSVILLILVGVAFTTGPGWPSDQDHDPELQLLAGCPVDLLLHCNLPAD